MRWGEKKKCGCQCSSFSTNGEKSACCPGCPVLDMDRLAVWFCAVSVEFLTWQTFPWTPSPAVSEQGSWLCSLSSAQVSSPCREDQLTPMAALGSLGGKGGYRTAYHPCFGACLGCFYFVAGGVRLLIVPVPCCVFVQWIL